MSAICLDWLQQGDETVSVSGALHGTLDGAGYLASASLIGGESLPYTYADFLANTPGGYPGAATGMLYQCSYLLASRADMLGLQAIADQASTGGGIAVKADLTSLALGVDLTALAARVAVLESSGSTSGATPAFTAAQGAQLAAVIFGVWALAFGLRQLRLQVGQS